MYVDYKALTLYMLHVIDILDHAKSLLHTLYDPSVSAQVPPVGVYLINESPRVTDNSVQADFLLTRPVYGVRCFLRSKFDRIWKDCEFCLCCV